VASDSSPFLRRTPTTSCIAKVLKQLNDRISSSFAWRETLQSQPAAAISASFSSGSQLVRMEAVLL
jgi:hypothetical protein